MHCEGFDQTSIMDMHATKKKETYCFSITSEEQNIMVQISPVPDYEMIVEFLARITEIANPVSLFTAR